MSVRRGDMLPRGGMALNSVGSEDVAMGIPGAAIAECLGECRGLPICEVIVVFDIGDSPRYFRHRSCSLRRVLAFEYWALPRLRCRS